MEKFKRGEKGELTIEASIVVVLVMLVVYLLFGIAFLFYQHFSIVEIANDTATRIARVYPILNAEPANTTIEKDDILSRKYYRYIFSNGDHETVNETKGDNLAKSLLNNITMLKKVDDPVIDTDIRHDAYAVRHVEVKVSATYRMPGNAIFKFFGLPETMTLSGVGRARCMDPIDYINSVDSIKHGIEKLEEGSTILNTYTNLVSFINKVVGWLT